MNKRFYICFVLLFSLSLNLRGQQPSTTPTPAAAQKPKTPGDQDQDLVRITTNLVQVDVVVTKDGKQVRDLKPEDFEIFDDGKSQKITEFSYISTVPPAATNEPFKAANASPSETKGPTVPAAQAERVKHGELSRF